VAQPQLGKQIGIGADLNGYAPAGRKPLSVGGWEVSIARRSEKIDPRSEAGKHELATSSRTRRKRWTMTVTRYRQSVEADNCSSKWAAGSLLQHDSLDGPSPDADGDSQKDKDAMHVCALHCYDAWRARSVDPETNLEISRLSHAIYFEFTLLYYWLHK
jgi:hypothetical protein